MTLYIRRREKAEADPFGEERVGDWGEPERVEGGLLAPGTPEGIGSDRPNGARVEATAHFPRGYSGALRGAQVSVDGSTWLSVVGDPQRYPAGSVPGPWDVRVLLEATEG